MRMKSVVHSLRYIRRGIKILVDKHTGRINNSEHLPEHSEACHYG
jgi:hypothetical protein